MSDTISFNTAKALCVHLGEPAGKELANLLNRLSARLEAVEHGKVDVIPVVPADTAPRLRVVGRSAA